MNCAEARRRLPAPNPPSGASAVPPEEAALFAHLAVCSPCQAEAEALAEVDQRLRELAAYKGHLATELLVRLDRQLASEGALTGREASSAAVVQKHKASFRFGVWIKVGLILVLLGVLVALRLRH